MSLVLAEFCAPWSRSLRLTTAGSGGMLLVVVLVGLVMGPQHLPLWRTAMVGMPLCVLFGALPFVVRGYVVTERQIEVRCSHGDRAICEDGGPRWHDTAHARREIRPNQNAGRAHAIFRRPCEECRWRECVDARPVEQPL